MSNPSSNNPIISLVDFQKKITKDITRKNTYTDSFVEILLNEDRWVIDLSQIMESIIPPYISKMANGPEWALGIFNFRGTIWEVIDMGVLLRNKPTSNYQKGWLTLLHPDKDNHIALLWSEIVEIKQKKEYNRQDNFKDSHKKYFSTSESFFCKDVWKRKTKEKEKDNILIKELNVENIIGKEGLINLWSFYQSLNLNK